MVEKKILVDEESLDYEGLFNLFELYSIIDDFFKLKGYDKFEPLNEESVYPEGKDIHVILTPVKWHTDYVQKVLKIELMMHEIKEVETEIDKVKVNMNKGKIKILFSCYLHTDWEGRWEGRPVYYFIRSIFDKYIYRQHTHNFEMEVIGDLNELRSKMGSFLNLYRFRKAV
ncbi:hypothetical protein HQ545_08400 [Candidatus Woesearchaeota archaeon]|nr:hypothetical protein [Candidatus Woesearchaeota archaeon]